MYFLEKGIKTMTDYEVKVRVRHDLLEEESIFILEKSKK